MPSRVAYKPRTPFYATAIIKIIQTTRDYHRRIQIPKLNPNPEGNAFGGAWLMCDPRGRCNFSGQKTVWPEVLYYTPIIIRPRLIRMRSHSYNTTVQPKKINKISSTSGNARTKSPKHAVQILLPSCLLYRNNEPIFQQQKQTVVCGHSLLCRDKSTKCNKKKLYCQSNKKIYLGK